MTVSSLVDFRLSRMVATILAEPPDTLNR